MVDVPLTVRQRDAQSNLESYIRRAKHELATFGKDLDFDAAVWDVTADSGVRISSAKKAKRLYFTTHEGGTSKSMDGRIPLSEPFGAFIKAMIRYRHEAKPKTADNHAVLLRAGRYLHDVLADRNYNPCRLMLADFNIAVAACKEREAETTQYRVGLFFAEIAEILNRYAICHVRLDFKNPFPRIVHDHSRIGEDFDKRRAEKLPAPEQLQALSEIANLVTESADILRMRAVELLACGGWRINELLTLPEACEVLEEAYETGSPLLDNNGDQIVRYGIRYWSEKIGDYRIKWIPTAMVDVAKRAIRDIREITRSARDLARFFENNPDEACFPSRFSQLEVFDERDLVELLNLAPGGAYLWLKAHSVPYRRVKGRLTVTRSDLNRAIISLQPDLPAASRLESSQHLFIVHRHFLNASKGTNFCVYDFVTDNQIDDFLQGRKTDRGDVASVFEKFGYTMPDGSPMRMNSHQFRHWLNTLAQRGGMGQHEIAKWFGRRESGENAAYDHVSGMELAARAREMMAAGRIKGPMAEIHDRLPPVNRQEFRNTVLNTMHPTEIGGCVNDWSVAPCPIHGECGKCNELLIEKGNVEQRANAEKLMEENQWLYDRAMAEVKDLTYGASNHLEHVKLVLQGLRKAVAVHDDPTIPNGTLVQLNGSLPEIYTNKALSSTRDE